MRMKRRIHTSWVPKESRKRLLAIAINNLGEFADGNCVKVLKSCAEVAVRLFLWMSFIPLLLSGGWLLQSVFGTFFIILGNIFAR